APVTAAMRRRLDTWLACAFLLALAAPSTDHLVRGDRGHGPALELREAEPRPPLPRGIWTLSEFPGRYERHFNDTFGLREQLLRWHSIVQVFGFGRSSTSAVLFGQDRWVFYTGDESIPNFRGLIPLSDPQIEEWLGIWEHRREFLAQRGIAY